MRDFLARRPSPAMAVAFVALLAALSGTAIALPGTNTVDSGDIKNNVVRSKDIRNNNVRGADIRNSTITGTDVQDDSLTGDDVNEGTLGQVPSANSANSANTANTANSATSANTATNADNANTLGGLTAAQLQTSSAFGQSAVVTNLGAAFTTVASTTITTHGDGRVLASGTAELTGAEADERGQCQIVIGGVSSLGYEAAPDDIGTSNEITISVEFARTLPAGTYAVAMQCREIAGTLSKDDAAISAFGLGA